MDREGIMKRSLKRRAAPQSAIRCCPSREDVIGFANLLRTAKASAKVCCPDQTCIGLLDQCLTRLTSGNEASWSGFEARSGGVMEFPALLRALRYAEAEAVENLNDRRSADLLRECIGRLTQIRLVEAHARPSPLAIN
jgi:hypothetical protein